MEAIRRVAIVMPQYNDWDCLPNLLAELNAVAASRFDFDVTIVNDGSTESMPSFPDLDVGLLERVQIVHLGGNLGHQRAIAVGLVEVTHDSSLDAIIVMDADGEDDPKNIVPLLRELSTKADGVVAAKRGHRYDGLLFRFCYGLYKWSFKVLTGQHLDFGNFCALSPSAVSRLSLMPALWNHFPSSIMRSGLPLSRICLDRRQRYLGSSKMNLTSLVSHGLSGIAVFVDKVFVRLLGFSVLVIAAMLSVVVVSFAVRIALGGPIPGWAALVATAATIVAIQAVGLLLMLTFTTLSMRSNYVPPPATYTRTYIKGRSELGPT